MQPLAELPEHALRRLHGLVFDIDDTLTTRGRLTAGAFEALWALHEAGLKLIAVTGRPLGWTDGMAVSWPVDLAVGENGAGWSCSRGRGLDVGYFHDASARREHELRLKEIRVLVEREVPGLSLASDQPARRCDLAFDIGERMSIDGPLLEKLETLLDEANARCLVSSVHAHAVVGDWDKARGVARAAETALGEDLARERERWLFVGDSGNDEAAFAFFEWTVGVANVRSHLHRLRVPPRWVTQTERGHGFAELAHTILRVRGG